MVVAADAAVSEAEEKFGKESGALPEDAHARLSGKLHVQCTRGGMMTSAEPVAPTQSEKSGGPEVLQTTTRFLRAVQRRLDV